MCCSLETAGANGREAQQAARPVDVLGHPPGPDHNITVFGSEMVSWTDSVFESTHKEKRELIECGDGAGGTVGWRARGGDGGSRLIGRLPPIHHLLSHVILIIKVGPILLALPARLAPADVVPAYRVVCSHVVVTSPEHFKELLSADLNRVSVLNFWAPWADVCKPMNEVSTLAACFARLEALWWRAGGEGALDSLSCW